MVIYAIALALALGANAYVANLFIVIRFKNKILIDFRWFSS